MVTVSQQIEASKYIIYTLSVIIIVSLLQNTLNTISAVISCTFTPTHLLFRPFLSCQRSLFFDKLVHTSKCPTWICGAHEDGNRRVALNTFKNAHHE